MSLLLLLKPKAAGSHAPPAPDLPPPSTANTARHKLIEPPRLERFLAGTATIFLRGTQPQLLLVPTAEGGTVRLASRKPDWDMLLEVQAKKQQIVYRATRDERDLDELAKLIYLLTRDPL